MAVAVQKGNTQPVAGASRSLQVVVLPYPSPDADRRWREAYRLLLERPQVLRLTHTLPGREQGIP
ncbi:MAG TPA: hypothetical protein VGN26_04780 [Armatimonadota bacterium]